MELATYNCNVQLHKSFGKSFVGCTYFSATHLYVSVYLILGHVASNLLLIKATY